MQQISLTNHSTTTPEQMAAWLMELANWLAERSDWVFECDCNPVQESDTGAWIHSDNCASHFEHHSDIILRSAAFYFNPALADRSLMPNTA